MNMATPGPTCSSLVSHSFLLVGTGDETMVVTLLCLTFKCSAMVLDLGYKKYILLYVKNGQIMSATITIKNSD